MTFEEWWDEQMAKTPQPFNMHFMCRQAWNAGSAARQADVQQVIANDLEAEAIRGTPHQEAR